ncbi:peptidase M16 domain protein [Gemmatirosa kalamazoonensis]|uniref:Peptidase M16 domain protein n=1 Tax=Gemmatirosa kalamazoonensis TaxID=861299 RepID=W0RBZ6_9BACT|nr:pitrilysin family protein [Gemmatirosa kalamazoonensis]AHG88301.1 peptidase M16 domain protein [Gemmatirosa kalamazoonensis]
MRSRLLAAAALGVVAVASPLVGQPPNAVRGLQVPVEYHKLPNGLRVVLSPDRTIPTTVVGVYYGVGFRNEPKDRTGFAHLFEHLMFQGSRNLGKMEFIKLVESSGGILNGSTRFDFTNYFEVVPSNTLERALWAEADRMRGLAITQDNLVNQQGVVKNEVRVNVLNQPYGGFPWLDMPQHANTNWQNAHNFYGDLTDLDAATLTDAQAFFKTYYAPNNAALVVTGDFDPSQALAWVRKYFAEIPSQPQPPAPDLSEPRQTAEKRATRPDPLAKRPALGIAYHVPERWTPEWFAFGLLDQILAQGRDSRLYDAVVRKRALAGGVGAGINVGLGNMFNYKGPMLYILSAIHDPDKSADTLVAVIDSTIGTLRDAPVDRATLDRALVKMRSNLYAQMEALAGFGKADMLASFALFDDDPARINRLEAGFAAVTPELLQRTAQEYLRPTNRTILTVVPAPAAGAKSSQ